MATVATAAKTRVSNAAPAVAPSATYTGLSPVRALAVPFVFTAALGAFVALPDVRANTSLLFSFVGTVALLVLWNVALLFRARARERRFDLEIILRKQHYLQACAQGSVLLYWGWYWREVYHSAFLIAAQIVFAYALDLLLVWSRRRTYTLGFGQFPVIFSTNLFLWFKPDWFYLQFVMIAVGFAAKELIKWDKDGRPGHVFNPSSFPLGVFSLALILTGTTRLTWGPEIASTLFYPPHIYLFIFLIGLPGQLLFGVATMTMSAVVTMYAFGLAYFAATGTYFFFDEYIPIAVFLGMHLLFTDPSTSPRTELGRILFGVLYALGVVTLYTWLGAMGAPTFYDKLLAVPILNLTIRLIDRLVKSSFLQRLDPAAIGRELSPFRRRAAYVGMWIIVFMAMSAAQGVGDTHRGHWVPFWQQACRENRRNACRNLAEMEVRYCDAGSGWACNELGVLFSTSEIAAAGTAAKRMFLRACGDGFSTGCMNTSLPPGITPRSADPALADLPIVLREGKGPLPPETPQQLYRRACSQGWRSACAMAQ